MIRANFKLNNFLFILIILCSSITYSQNHLRFDGVDSYVTFGNSSTLGLSTFTLEAWIYPTGTGVTASSGIGGISAIPVITKGRGESGSEGTIKDMNYFLGIIPSTMVLTADFEEGASGSNPGDNHPITGTTTLNLNQWYHVAATYDGNDWYLYLDGSLEGTKSVGEPCQNLSIQHSAVGSALLSTGDPQGYFEGEIDEVRIWNLVRTQLEIQDNMNKEITSSVSGLVSAWNMNEGAGTFVNGVGGISGQIINSYWSWVNLNAWNNTYYVSTSGNDANDGSETNPWLTIQSAINNASVADGDVIIVKDGTYNENVNVTKEITLQSENGYLTTTVVAVYTGEDHVIEVLANNVTIEGFTAYGATAVWNSSGIGLVGVNNCTINSNRCGLDAIHQNWLAINVRGNSDNNTISNNIMSFNKCYGINIREGSDNNLLLNNEISNNGDGGFGGYGIQNCENSVSNIVRGNVIENNETFGVQIITHGINLGNNDVDDKGKNTIRGNTQYDVNNGTSYTINAYYNIWGSNDEATIDSHINDNEEGFGEVYFYPWIESEIELQLDLTVLLEGPYNSGDMNTSLLDQESIPNDQPFNVSPWNYKGTENVDPIPANIVDWVLVELRTAEAASSMVKQVPAFVDKDGNVVNLDGVSSLKINHSDGVYYIVVYHRNHLPIMTQDMVHLGP